MDFERILMAALLGGMFAGAGGGLGSLLAGHFPHNFRNVIIGGFAAIGLVLSQFAGNALKSHSVKNELHNELQKNQMFVIIKDGFPEEYASFLRELSQTNRDDSAFKLGNQFTKNLRQIHAEHLRSASSAKLLDLIEADWRLTNALRERDGDELCSAFLLEGAGSLPNGLTPYSDDAELSIEALFLAISEGRELDNPRSSPSEADWVKFLEHWRSGGANDEMIFALTNPDTAGTNFCGTYLSFLTELISYEVPEADALRAEHMFQKAILE